MKGTCCWSSGLITCQSQVAESLLECHLPANLCGYMQGSPHRLSFLSSPYGGWMLFFVIIHMLEAESNFHRLTLWILQSVYHSNIACDVWDFMHTLIIILLWTPPSCSVVGACMKHNLALTTFRKWLGLANAAKTESAQGNPQKIYF